MWQKITNDINVVKQNILLIFFKRFKILLEDSDYEPEQETICEGEDDNYCGENNDSDFSEGEVRRKTISKETKANRKKSSKENIESGIV